MDEVEAVAPRCRVAEYLITSAVLKDQVQVLLAFPVHLIWDPTHLLKW